MTQESVRRSVICMFVWNRQLWLEHLQYDIMQFWKQPGCLGTPIGNFPTFIDQNGIPEPGKIHYMRMQGRRIYGFLAAGELLKNSDYLEWGKRGLEWLEKYAVNPEGGYFSQLTSEGIPLKEPVTIQDLSYTVFPYLKYYKLTGEKSALKNVADVLDLILNGPFVKNGTLVDSLSWDYTRVCYFEGNTLNIVSLLDLMNLLLVPLMNEDDDDVINTFFPDLTDLVERLLDFLVSEFYGADIFWNEKNNRSDYAAKHVDLGHTSKAYGVLFQANRCLIRHGRKVKYLELEKKYLPILQAASDPIIGWRTDFYNSPVSFRPDSVQWWRYILIDQTAALYAAEYPELEELLENGLQKWLELPFVDRKREVRGIREGLRADGTIWTDEDSSSCKANLWKSSYHEVEHVESILAYISKKYVQ